MKCDLDTVFDVARKAPGALILEGKLRGYYDYAIRGINPEALGSQAKTAAAIVAKGIADAELKDSRFIHDGEVRRLWWEKNIDKARDFLRRYDQGNVFTGRFNTAAAAYRRLTAEQKATALAHGIKHYDSIDHFLPRLFENPAEAELWLDNKYGNEWKKVGTFKDSELIDALTDKAGFKLRYDNPDDIFHLRQSMLDSALMRLSVMKDMVAAGIAWDAKGHPPTNRMVRARTAPDGHKYWVDRDADQLLTNAFDQSGLWGKSGPIGDTFRFAMEAKNRIVPLRLMGLFHPLHVAGASIADVYANAGERFLAGIDSPGTFIKNIAGAGLAHWGKDLSMGKRILQLHKGIIPKEQMSLADQQVLRLMAEGGYIPVQASHYKASAIRQYKNAVARGSASVAWKAPFAALQVIQTPVFEYMIPILKNAAWMRNAQTALEMDPKLLIDKYARMERLRQITKSIDNRNGEMNYRTMFWDKTIKDIGTLNTLSMGWQIGLIREYGGGMMDLGHVIAGDGSIASKAQAGKLHRPLFMLMYTTQSLMVGALATWWWTGQPPTQWLDYIYPKSGQKNPDGSDARTSTMYYTKEPVMLAKHIQQQGVAGGLKELAESKASGLFGLAHEAITGVNSWGDQIRNPYDKWYQKLGQTLEYVLGDMMPMSVTSLGDDFGANAKTARSVAGFSPAPKYITQSPTNAAIDQIYKESYARRQTPYEQAMIGADRRHLEHYRENLDTEAFNAKLEEMREKYKLAGDELEKIRRSVVHHTDPQLHKFEMFAWPDQKALLDKMTPEERRKFRPHANKEKRQGYKPPDDE